MAHITNYIARNQPDSHQSVPRCLAKFVCYRDRDTFYKSDSDNAATATHQHPFNADATHAYTIVSDILSCNITHSKSSGITTGEMVLSSGDFNYQATLLPGDHCMVWMLNDEAKYAEIDGKVRLNQQANDFNSGLKFVGRVNSVRTVYNTEERGEKSLRYLVTLKGFQELQSMIYYNPLLFRPSEEGGASAPTNTSAGSSNQSAGLQFFARISAAWAAVVLGKAATGISPGDFITFFVNTFLGTALQDVNSTSMTVESPDAAFVIPSAIGATLGVSQSSTRQVRYIDILKTFLGVQKYSSTRSMLPTNLTTPTITAINNCVFPMKGIYLAPPDSFAGPSIWQLMNTYLNPALNEIYVTVKAADAHGNIFPTLVARQIPFTSAKFDRNVQATNGNSEFNNQNTQPTWQQYTKFSEITRWVIDPAYTINSYNFGTSDSIRFNFTQFFGSFVGDHPSMDSASQMQLQISAKNYAIDPIDIARNGTKINILQTNTPIQGNPNNVFDLGGWAALAGDFYINGHLKLTGSLTVPGIQLPISIGDNLQIDHKLFHIENITHSYAVTPNGFKSFTTAIQLSNGVIADKYDSYVMTQSKKRYGLSDTVQPGYTDSEILVTGTQIESSGEKDGN
jgi:hypothetical protein